ncbi:MAG: DUF1361 domain-containing protein [Anaerolineae bacterium]
MNELRTAARLAVGCLGFTTLLMARIIYTGTPVYAFLLWNLVLALLPLLFAGLAVRTRSRMLTGAFGLLWLLFLPNAPYLMTDLIHLRYGNSEGALALLDAVLLFSGALCGVALGLQSLRWLHTPIKQRWGNLVGWAFAILSLGLSSVGMYVGRTLRWNSWDVLTRPRPLLLEMAGYVANPLTHWRMWGIILLFAALLIYLYWLMDTPFVSKHFSQGV